MAHAIRCDRCDRCGKYFNREEPELAYTKVEARRKIYKKYGPIRIWRKNDNWKYIDQELLEKDLCPECNEKLDLFLDGAEVVTKDDE